MRKTIINKKVILNEYKDGLLYGTDALLLAAYAQGSKKRIGCDLGSGSGVISLLTLSSGYAKKMIAVEIQEKYAELTKQNFFENNFTEQSEVFCCNVNELSKYISSGSCDFVLSNPPYMPRQSGKQNISEEKCIARHELNGNISDFCNAASWCLRTGGSFYIVYIPERMAELFQAMIKAKLIPKRLKTIHPSPALSPSLILCEGKKDASFGLIYERPLYIYTDSTHKHYTDEMETVVKTIKISRQR